MLKSLRIRNLAIIDQVTLDLGAGFTVLTGETGAGKSILIDAIGLLLGTRADAALVRAGTDKAEIDAEFSLADAPAARQWLEENELVDADDPQHCLLRRVVLAEGRARAFINGSQVPATSLRDLSERLLEIFGQNDSQTLRAADTQRGLLDDFGAHGEILDEVRSAASRWQQTRERLDAARAAGARDPAQLDFLRYQWQELQALDLRDSELAQLDQEHRRLANAGRLIEDGTLALDRLYDGDTSTDGQLSGVLHRLEGLAALDEQFVPIVEALSGAQQQIREAVDALRRRVDRLELDPVQLAEVEQRVATIQNLARKHRLRADALPARLIELASELEAADRAAADVGRIETELSGALAEYRVAAGRLRAARRSAAAGLSEAVTQGVRRLGMAHARFEAVVEASSSERPRAHGDDEVRFDFSANPGQPPRPLSKVASGGELSRLSLALQVAASRDSGCATMIFDEVDAGVGGGVAQIVGSQLRELGAHRQVLCVTHLAQVAAQGRQHFAIRKQSDANHTYTRVSPLDASARVEELARMLGGVEITASTQALAREMLGE